MRQLATFLLISIISATTSFAQILKPVKWTWEAKHIEGNEFELIYTAKIDDGWSIYSQYLESDEGPVRTSFEYDEGNHYTLVGKNEESGGRKESFDKVFEMNVIKFKKNGIFTQKVAISDYSKPVSGYLTFMTCDDKRCLAPADVDFEFKLTAPATAAKTEKPVLEKPKAAAVVPAEKPTTGPAQKNKSKKESETIGETSAKTESTGKIAPPQEVLSPEESPAAGRGGFQNPVTWSFTSRKKSDTAHELVFNGIIDDGWYVYSQFQESEDGPLPAEFNFDEAKSYKLVGKAEESGGLKTAHDKVFDMIVNKFSHDVIFTQQVEVSDPSKPITGYFTFQVCDDKSCTKFDVDYYADPANEQAYLGEEAMKRTDAYNTSLAGGDVGPKREGNVINQEVQSIKTTFNDPVGDCGGGGQNEGGWIWAFIFGFGGGLLALITPCVFPMIPLTVSFFTKGSNSRAAGIRNGLIYGASIILIYVTMGLLVTGIFGPEALNALSTHWLSNMIFFAVFIIFAISFFGYFEITLPSSLANKSDQMADKGGFIGIFFMAATLAIVSFSCTGPIVGTALVQTASNPVGPFFVMLGFSMALALPFGLFAAFPAWLNSMPRSGSWMTNVKVVLGFVELALALKFFSVADYTYHWGILKYELFMGLWVLIAAAMTLYLFGFIRFPHDSKVVKLSPTRWTFAFLTLALTIYLSTGFRYDDITKSYSPPGLMSGLAPPASYNFLLAGPQVNDDLKTKYPSLTKCANNLDCFKDYYEGMAYAKEMKMPILLDFTGYGCVNCRKTEDFIWVKPPVRNNIDQNFVLISLYVDDPTKLEEELISASRKNKIRNVGNKWADFQIVNFEGNAQPLYVLMSADEKVLAYPRGYLEGWAGYNDFLNCGLETFKNYQKGTIGLKE
ncbi:MAG: thiol:disulfide interchange protein [Saprospiraceae bacterium]|jgi:thiol:disulfide interchange protein